MKVHHPGQLTELRNLAALKEIHVDADAFLAGNLPLYLFKYVVWALAKGGTAQIIAPRTIDSMGIVPGAWSFQFLLQTACKAIEGNGSLTYVDISTRTFSFQRTSLLEHKEPWSAVVMFSGREAEHQQLDRCLRSLLAQVELSQGGQIAVCGPEEASHVIKPYGNVEYLPFETPVAAGRFLVGKKKNFAIAHMRNDRILVCHSRIVLDEGCLRQIPAEFEVITPRVWVHGRGSRQIPYADLLFHRFHCTSVYTDHTPPFLGYSRTKWLDFLSFYQPFIDGGMFCIKKSIASTIQLSEMIAWGEGEDVEWCRRLLDNGKILELCSDASAQSLVNKTNHYIKWGHLPGFGNLVRSLRRIQTFLRRVTS